MCLLNNHYLTQFEDNNSAVSSSFKSCASLFFLLLQAAVQMPGNLNLTEHRRIIMGKGNKNTEVMHADITNAKSATDFFVHSSHFNT